MATKPSPEDTAKQILDMLVVDLRVRPPNGTTLRALIVQADARGIHREDLVEGLDYAGNQKGWVDNDQGSNWVRLNASGFTAATQAPTPNLGTTPVSGPVNVSSSGQAGGITAHTVNIAGGPPPGPPSQPPKPSWWDSGWNRIGVGAGILVAVLALLDYCGVKPHTAHTPEQPAAQVDTLILPPNLKPQQQKHTAAMKQPPGQQEPQPQAPSTQPAAQSKVSVSSQHQSGGITAGTVNIYGQKQQRHLDQQGTGFLMQHIPKSAKVTVTAVMGDGEAFTYAQEIADWMRGNKWTNVDGVNQAIFSGLVFGQGINPKPDGSFDIQIGNQR
ncbi:MAG: hypothetical protein JWO52_3842 [Gammaproteobacteria bacterium]|nr:hypothetical protein [Gammaproteobacteria bacterium]